MRTDREILRNSIAQVLELDLTAEHGWREGTGYYHLSIPPGYGQPDLSVGENLIARGILMRHSKWRSRLILTESALVRIMHVAMEAALQDLLSNDPPEATLPETPSYYDNGSARLIFTGLNRDELAVRE